MRIVSSSSRLRPGSGVNRQGWMSRLAGIHIVVADGAGRPGVPAAGYPAFRETLIQKLYQLTSPVTGEPLIARVWRREEIFAGPYQALAPDLTLSLRDGGLVSILPSDVPVRRREEVTGAHRPEGVFLARGPGIRSGCTLPSLSILDVAPTVLYCLGLPIPADLEGQAALTLFEPAQAQARPAQRETLSSPTGPSSGQFVYDAETEAAILARLRALGYVD